MPKNVTLYTIFVASPGDTHEERSRIQPIVEELNVTHLQQRGIRLDLIKWETHTFPGISEDSQAVINEQIPDDYDIFVGIMWHRFGTPTGRAESGTIEEFEKAKKRYEQNSSSVKIMFYFKETPISPSDIDPDQLKKVQAFRDSLQQKQGVLYQKFNSVDEFEKFFRMQIALQINELEKKTASPQSDEPDSTKDEAVPEPRADDEDKGLLELQESFEKKFEELTDITNRISNYIEELGEKVSDRDDEIKQLVDKYSGNPNRNEVKRLLAKTAKNMDEFVDQMEDDLPNFGSSFDDGMDLMIHVVEISHEYGLANTEDFREILKATNTMNNASLDVEKQIIDLRSVIANIPPITSTLKKSRNAVTTVLDKLVEKLKGVQSLTCEAERIIGEVLQK